MSNVEDRLNAINDVTEEEKINEEDILSPPYINSFNLMFESSIKSFNSLFNKGPIA